MAVMPLLVGWLVVGATSVREGFNAEKLRRNSRFERNIKNAQESKMAHHFIGLMPHHESVIPYPLQSSGSK